MLGDWPSRGATNAGALVLWQTQKTQRQIDANNIQQRKQAASTAHLRICHSWTVKPQVSEQGKMSPPLVHR